MYRGQCIGLNWIRQNRNAHSLGCPICLDLSQWWERSLWSRNTAARKAENLAGGKPGLCNPWCDWYTTHNGARPLADDVLPCVSKWLCGFSLFAVTGEMIHYVSIQATGVFEGPSTGSIVDWSSTVVVLLLLRASVLRCSALSFPVMTTP